jgi:hypothetical protein
MIVDHPRLALSSIIVLLFTNLITSRIRPTMFSRSTSLLRSSLRTSSSTPLVSRSFASTTLLRNSTANASQSTHDARQARDDGEQKIYDKLKNKFSPKTLDVMDVSGTSSRSGFDVRLGWLTNCVLAIGSSTYLHISLDKSLP